MPLNGRAPSRFFPSIAFPSYINNTTHTFTYLRPLELDVACVTFHARTLDDPPREIVVKFVQTHGQDTQNLLANTNMAPQLLYCGAVSQLAGAPSYSPLKMIVMEYISDSVDTHHNT
jgi:hypothetical protein